MSEGLREEQGGRALSGRGLASLLSLPPPPPPVPPTCPLSESSFCRLSVNDWCSSLGRLASEEQRQLRAETPGAAATLDLAPQEQEAPDSCVGLGAFPLRFGKTSQALLSAVLGYG